METFLQHYNRKTSRIINVDTSMNLIRCKNMALESHIESVMTTKDE